jgi:hypothetical protein
MAYEQFTEGLEAIEREIINQIGEAGGEIATSAFRWYGGKRPFPPPRAIGLEIITPCRIITTTFSRAEVEDCWDRLDRSDVLGKVHDLVQEFTKPQEALPTSRIGNGSSGTECLDVDDCC